MEELGDLLLQVAMHAEIADQEGRFDAAQVSEAVAAKMVKRHPHVFGDKSVADADEVLRNWEHQKMRESRQAGNEKAVAWVAAAGEGAHEGTFADAAAFGEVLVNATAGMGSLDALSSAGAANLAGKVLIAEITGSESVVHFDLGGLTWVSLSHGVRAFPVGESARFEIDVAQALYFGADGARVG